MIITSKANSAIKQIRSLRARKDRDHSGLFFVEGVRIVGEAVELGADIDSIVVAPDLLTSRYARSLLERIADTGTLLEVSKSVFESISAKEGPQGIGAVIRQRWTALQAIDPSGDFCWLALDSVQDPGNLGTIVRTSDAVGGAGVILLGPSTDPYDPAALRAGMGAVFSQHLVRARFGDLVSWAGRHNCMVVGTSDAAETDYQSVRYRSPLILLMGSERQGLSKEEAAVCESVVSIPMVGRSDSLNLAVATGVMVYEAFNQKREMLPGGARDWDDLTQADGH